MDAVIAGVSVVAALSGIFALITAIRGDRYFGSIPPPPPPEWRYEMRSVIEERQDEVTKKAIETAAKEILASHEGNYATWPMTPVSVSSVFDVNPTVCAYCHTPWVPNKNRAKSCDNCGAPAEIAGHRLPPLEPEGRRIVHTSADGMLEVDYLPSIDVGSGTWP